MRVTQSEKQILSLENVGLPEKQTAQPKQDVQPVSVAPPPAKPEVQSTPQPKSAILSQLRLNPQTARSAVLYAEIFGKPVSRQRRYGKR